MKSKFLTLNKKDGLKGLLMAVLGAVLTAVYQAIEGGTFAFTWAFFKPVLLIGLGTGISYILKNFLTNSKDQTFKKELKIK